MKEHGDEKVIGIYFQGFYGIEDEVYLSLPCVLGENGVSAIIKQHLTTEEVQKLQKSAKIMADHITQLKMQ